MKQSWDKAADVVVVGYGFAGAVAAIIAHDLGAQVLILEKMPYYGGNSILAGGGFRIAKDAQGAFQYLKRTCLNTVPVDVLEVIAEGLTELADFIRHLGEEYGLETDVKYGRGTYPFPGGESLGHIKIKNLKGFDGFPWIRVGLTATGQNFFKVLVQHVEQRGIEVMLSTPVKELVADHHGRVLGVVAEKEGVKIGVNARKAVILACGGFEFNEQLKLQFFEAQPVYGICAVGNTGDGILLAQKMGAQLWHTWHIHGSYGFKHPDLPIGLRHRFAGGRDDYGARKMPWIVVDKFGRRYMNEQPPAPQDTPWRPMSYYDADIQDYPRIPSYMIMDEEGRKTGPLFVSYANDLKYAYDWSIDNSVEIEKGWIKKGNTVEELASKLNIDPSSLRNTVDKWNSYCQEMKDSEFRRPPAGMMPIRAPPFYGATVWPIVTNTQGGIAHNAKQQVIDVYGNPIPRLYVAGELSSIFGHLYLQSGNASECIIAGRQAARYACQEVPLESL